jgi:hypothetical protein
MLPLSQEKLVRPSSARQPAVNPQDNQSSTRLRVKVNEPGAQYTIPSSQTASGPLPRVPSQKLPVPVGDQSIATADGTAMTTSASDEDMVIFESMRVQLIIWLRVEAIRSNLETNGLNPFQLVEALRHQEGMDLSRLQVVSTLLTMCEQILSKGQATIYDYKQSMMFYLMHTRNTR